MNRKTMLKIAKECGPSIHYDGECVYTFSVESLERFARRMQDDALLMAAKKFDEHPERDWWADDVAVALRRITEQNGETYTFKNVQIGDENDRCVVIAELSRVK